MSASNFRDKINKGMNKRIEAIKKNSREFKYSEYDATNFGHFAFDKEKKIIQYIKSIFNETDVLKDCHIKEIERILDPSELAWQGRMAEEIFTYFGLSPQYEMRRYSESDISDFKSWKKVAKMQFSKAKLANLLGAKARTDDHVYIISAAMNLKLVMVNNEMPSNVTLEGLDHYRNLSQIPNLAYFWKEGAYEEFYKDSMNNHILDDRFFNSNSVRDIWDHCLVFLEESNEAAKRSIKKAKRAIVIGEKK